ncbi:uncharacterized protein LOC131425880 [Malaya genurostris]|uniref:uncharacterized protein LOC131425880 n=1 Tax=Malaya genurostris TaxID=325434 RepID=UPI0026F3AD87|nr:uncharacterized protein LOC131425880 [Malaya genurostris]
MNKSPSTLELAWSADLQHVIFREIGTHCTRQCRFPEAIANLRKATEANPSAVDCHRRKTTAHLQNLELHGALESCRTGMVSRAMNEDSTDDVGFDIASALLESKILFEMADFEEHIKVSFTKKNLVPKGHRKDLFDTELILALGVYESTLGRKAGSCLYKLRKTIMEISKQNHNNQNLDNRPEWKIRKDKGECDALSIAEVNTTKTHIREKELIAKNMRMLGQMYLNGTSADLDFLHSLKEDKLLTNIVKLPQTNESSSALQETIEDCHGKVLSSLRQLHAAFPIYAYRKNQFGTTARANAYKEENIFRYRYKTYRDVYNQLDRLHELRQQGNVPELVRFAETVLWNYFQIKTDRVFPDRYKFVTEVCNLIGLAMLDQLQIPPTLMDERPKDRLHTLFDLPFVHEHDLITPVFGDKSTYRDPAAPDYKYMAYKNRLNNLDERVNHSRYPIERAFWLHEMCICQLNANKLSEARNVACRVIEEASQAGSNLWYFLGVLILVKADCSQRNLEKLSNSLDEAAEASMSLDDSRLTHLIKVAQIINRNMINEKTKRRKTMMRDRAQKF